MSVEKRRTHVEVGGLDCKKRAKEDKEESVRAVLEGMRARREGWEGEGSGWVGAKEQRDGR